jgi:hypothetical protein
MQLLGAYCFIHLLVFVECNCLQFNILNINEIDLCLFM